MKFSNEDDELKNLFLDIRSVYGFPYKILTLDFVLTDPNGKKRVFTKDLLFEKDNLDCTGDFCDQEVLILEGLKMKRGLYSLKITDNNTPIDVYGLIEFRLIEE